MDHVSMMVKAVQEYIRRCLTPLAERIKALEFADEVRRNAGGINYHGVWTADREYPRGSFVTLGGSLWFCRTKFTRDRPGSGPSWVLAVKGGRQ